MKISLDRRSLTPLHLQVAHGIRDLILKGAISEGGRLPPTRKLAQSLGVNRSTVVQAYETLWAEGLIESHVGRGTIVCPSVRTKAAAIAPPMWRMLFAPRHEAIEAEVRELSRLFDREDVISFAAGLPAPDLYPIETLADLTRDILARDGRSLLQWCSVEGYLPLRRLLADQIHGVTAGEILILSGSTQGLWLLAHALIEPGDDVIVEAPTYLGALQAFRAAGARVLGVPTDDEGMDTRMLENVLSRANAKFIYTLPTFQNPTGATMSLERRRSLLDLAYRYRVPIIEDDAYPLLRYEGETLPSLKALDTEGYVIYLSTFSKVLLPGLRVGWLVAPKRVIEHLIPSKQLLDIFTNSLGQAVVEQFLRGGLFEQHLERVRNEYRRRRDAMAGALRRYCPGVEIRTPDGGFYIWSRLPGEISARELLGASIRAGVSFLSGEIFYSDGRGKESIRLSFASQAPGHIEEGVKRLGRAIRRLRKAGPTEAAATEPLTRPIV